MIQISRLLPKGAGLAPVLLKRASTVQLGWDLRQKNRFEAVDSLGRLLNVFLPSGSLIRAADVLVAQDGSIICVVAAPQKLLRITACAAHGSPFDLARAAYHLGKRQVPTELQPDHLKIEPDQMLADMLRAMHLIVTEVEEAFEPEGVKISSSAHSHGNDHAHESAPEHQHGAAAMPSHSAQPGPHVHGPDCNHDHDHDQSHDQIKPVPIQIHKHKPLNH